MFQIEMGKRRLPLRKAKAYGSGEIRPMPIETQAEERLLLLCTDPLYAAARRRSFRPGWLQRGRIQNQDREEVC